MPRFKIEASEISYLSAIVEADTIEEAREKAENFDCSFDTHDSDSFEILSIEPYVPPTWRQPQFIRPPLRHPTIKPNP